MEPSNPQAFFVTLISGLVSVVLTVIALLHPGFHETARVQETLTTVVPIVGGAIAFWYVHQSHKTQQAVLKVAEEAQKARQDVSNLISDGRGSIHATEPPHVGGHELPA